IESRLQLAITLCVAALIIVTTLGNSGGAPVVFFIYRTLLMSIAILCTIGSRRADLRISAMFLAWVTVLFLLMLISVIRIPGSHFEGSYLWYRYAFFAWAFLSLANYARYQSAGWKAVFLLTIVAVGLVHLAPGLVGCGPGSSDSRRRLQSLFDRQISGSQSIRSIQLRPDRNLEELARCYCAKTNAGSRLRTVRSRIQTVYVSG